MLESDLLPWGVVLDESVDVLRKVNHDDQNHQQRDGKEECANELAEYVGVDAFHPIFSLSPS